MNYWDMITTEGSRLKRIQLHREISHLKDPTERANLEHTYSKLFMFLEEDIERALRIAGQSPYNKAWE